MKMGAFLSVAQGAVDEPRLIVLRYHGGKEGEAPVALVGKGIMFDSGGYSLKSKMDTMHDDMGGAAAVIGAIRAIALEKLPVNVIAVAAACENMISGDAYVPGDILFSMNGKTIEMLNADAEGRLTLADAITYAIRKEGAGAIIDIATLTGAAKALSAERARLSWQTTTSFTPRWKLLRRLPARRFGGSRQTRSCLQPSAPTWRTSKTAAPETPWAAAASWPACLSRSSWKKSRGFTWTWPRSTGCRRATPTAFTAQAGMG